MNKASFESESIDSLLSDSAVRENLALARNEIKDILREYLRSYANVADPDIDGSVHELLTQGFPLTVRSGFGTLTGHLKLTESIIIWWANLKGQILGQVGLDPANYAEVARDPKIVEAVRWGMCETLRVFMSNLESELEAVVADSYRLGMAQLYSELTGAKPEQTETINLVTKAAAARRKKTANIRPGGNNRPPSFWDDRKKVAFYRQVEELPTVGRRPLWKFIFNELADCDFDLEAQAWLRKRKEVRVIPVELFNEAVQKWRKYDSLTDIKSTDEKPRFFEYRLALHLLGFPDKFPFHTMNTQFKDGRKLAKRGFIDQ